jgi:uncharacterized protein YjbJ (UPF0337 family)
MSDGKTDKVKGRLKEAAGVLTGDEKLKREGQVQQAAGDIKEAVSDAVDKAASLLKPKKKKSS